MRTPQGYCGAYRNADIAALVEDYRDEDSDPHTDSYPDQDNDDN
jgi:hypothetical protein